MNVLVVGGAGFIGSHLCDDLIKKGYKVYCMDNLSLGTRANIAHLENQGAFELIKGDASDREEIEAVFAMAEPEYVFHLAANSDIQASASSPDVEYRNTYTTTYEILMAMRRHGVKRIFFASTSAVYGEKKDVLLSENTPNLSPISYYGAAKLGSEALISAFTYMNDMTALVFRFPNVIGPRLTHGVIYDFIRKLKLDSSKLEILGDGKQTKPYIYVKDLVAAIASLSNIDSNVEETGVRLYNVGVEGATSVTAIADILCEEMGLCNVKYEYTGGEGGWKGDVPRFTYSTEKIRAEGWKPEYNSDDAVRLTVKSIIGV
ncbi:MAG: SDR family NAD(P)-dependent oxidoreductase [Lachnospiraceae bacterium]|nr:SDR family NAD(P)-dependent oxidoreductase [Lachnospiraceae bacterium]